MSELEFVQGGEIKSPRSNRMAQSASELHAAYPLEDDRQADLKYLLQSQDTIEGMVGFFRMCNDSDVHIVGSNDTVYNSGKYMMLCEMIRDGKIPQGASLNFFTRNLGLRHQLIKIVSEM